MARTTRELSDAQWAKLAPLLPAQRPRMGRPPRVVEGPPALMPLTAAEGADLPVVGSHGRGGFVGMLLGSVSQHCVQHATCPVVVVRYAKDKR